MIHLTSLHGRPIYLNEDLIERVVPGVAKETVVFTTKGNVYTVTETAEEISAAVRQEKAAILHLGHGTAGRPNLHLLGGSKDSDAP